MVTNMVFKFQKFEINFSIGGKNNSKEFYDVGE